MPGNRHPLPTRRGIERREALALLALARELQPPGDGVSFRLSGIQARAARVALGRTVDGIATLAGLPSAAVENVEAGVNTRQDDVAKIGGVLEALGATFVRRGGVEAIAFRAA